MEQGKSSTFGVRRLLVLVTILGNGRVVYFAVLNNLIHSRITALQTLLTDLLVRVGHETGRRHGLTGEGTTWGI